VFRWPEQQGEKLIATSAELHDLEPAELKATADGPQVGGFLPPAGRRGARIGVALLFIVAAIAAGLGALWLTEASADRQDEEQQVVAFSQLEDRLAELRTTTDARLSETERLGEQAATTRRDVEDVEADTARLESDISEIEDPTRAVQTDIWALYESVAAAVAIENRITATMEDVVASGNQRRMDDVETTVARLASSHMRDVESAVEAVDTAVDQLALALAAAGAPFDISEDFEGAVGGWEAGFDTNGTAEAVDGAYEITAHDNGYLMWGLSPYDVADSTISVTATPVDGPDEGLFSYGLLCRSVQTDHLAGYWFSVDSNGSYQVGLFVPPGDFEDLLPSGRQHYPSNPSALDGVVNTGFAANRIDVVCDGTVLSLTVNGELLWEGSDERVSSGTVAFSAITYDDAPVTVRFDDVRLTGGRDLTGGEP